MQLIPSTKHSFQRSNSLNAEATSWTSSIKLSTTKFLHAEGLSMVIILVQIRAPKTRLTKKTEAQNVSVFQDSPISVAPKLQLGIVP